MKKTILSLMLVFLFLLGLVSCGENETTTPTPEEPTIDLGDYELELKELKIVHNDCNVIYLGEKFTAEGYDILIVYRIKDSGGESIEVECTNYTIDDSRVDYSKIGSYQVIFTARVGNVVFKKAGTIRIAESFLCEKGINHLYGIKADEYTGANINIGQTDFSDVDIASVYLIYTEGKYNGEELLTTEVKKRSGYKLDYSHIDSSKAGSYPVYVSYSEQYEVDGEIIDVTVETFFIVVVE